MGKKVFYKLFQVFISVLGVFLLWTSGFNGKEFAGLMLALWGNNLMLEMRYNQREASDEG